MSTHKSMDDSRIRKIALMNRNGDLITPYSNLPTFEAEASQTYPDDLPREKIKYVYEWGDDWTLEHLREVIELGFVKGMLPPEEFSVPFLVSTLRDLPFTMKDDGRLGSLLTWNSGDILTASSIMEFVPVNTASVLKNPTAS